MVSWGYTFKGLYLIKRVSDFISINLYRDDMSENSDNDDTYMGAETDTDSGAEMTNTSDSPEEEHCLRKDGKLNNFLETIQAAIPLLHHSLRFQFTYIGKPYKNYDYIIVIFIVILSEEMGSQKIPSKNSLRRVFFEGFPISETFGNSCPLCLYFRLFFG